MIVSLARQRKQPLCSRCGGLLLVLHVFVECKLLERKGSTISQNYIHTIPQHPLLFLSDEPIISLNFVYNEFLVRHRFFFNTCRIIHEPSYCPESTFFFCPCQGRWLGALILLASYHARVVCSYHSDNCFYLAIYTSLF